MHYSLEEPPASGPVSPPPRALRPAELALVLRALVASGSLPAQAAVTPASGRQEIAPAAIDLLAGAMGDEPISAPPPAIHPGRALRSGPRLRRFRAC
jgi:hypothetical protein